VLCDDGELGEEGGECGLRMRERAREMGDRKSSCICNIEMQSPILFRYPIVSYAFLRNPLPRAVTHTVDTLLGGFTCKS
jgi:hypothetical protein